MKYTCKSWPPKGDRAAGPSASIKPQVGSTLNMRTSSTCTPILCKPNGGDGSALPEGTAHKNSHRGLVPKAQRQLRQRARIGRSGSDAAVPTLAVQ